MGKGFMFMAFVFLAVCIAGGVVEGSFAMSATRLTVAIDEDDTTITVADTEGFLDTGIMQIGDERIGYSDITPVTFVGSATQPMVRGAESTDAAAHAVGSVVRTVANSMMNSSAAYNIAVITDASGVWAAVTIPLAVLRLLGSYLILPLDFLGTDLVILTYLWAVFGVGMIVAVGLALAGGRRV